MRELTDFVNHGILPFVGREDLFEEILAFWVETVHRGGLGALLIEAPAGRGKTRLVEEIAAPVYEQGGILLRVRLYPETSASLATSLEHQISLTEHRLHLPEGPTDLFSRLRRLLRLRPTLLALEDLHLLDEESTGELSGLFAELEDEPLALLFLSRPLPEEIRSMIGASLVIRSRQLPGLDKRHLTALWTLLFGPPSSDRLIDLLLRTTRGNPLALRSSLRGLIDRKILVAHGEEWELACSIEEYAESLQQNVRRLLEGMASNLLPEEYRATLILARLGEVFSQEAAATMLPASARLIEQLIFKGVIRSTETFSIPLNSVRSGSTLLHFTHTLLHEHCRAQPIESQEILFSPLLSECPHYSYSYFRVLLEIFEEVELDREKLEYVITSVREVINGANHHPGWRNLKDVHILMERLVERGVERSFWNEEEVTFYRGLTEIMWTVAFNRHWRESEYAVRSRKLEEISRAPRSERMARMRLRALSHMIEITQLEKDDEGTLAVDAEVESLLTDFPALQIDEQYFYYLGRILQRAPHLGSLCDLVLDRYAAISERISDLDENQRRRLKRLSTHLLPMFRTQHEFKDRLALLASLENDSDVPDYLLNIHREQALLSGGLLEKLVRKIEITRASIESLDDRLGRHSLYWIERSAWLFLGVEEEVIDELLVRPTESDGIYHELALWHQFTYHSLVLGIDAILAKIEKHDHQIVRRLPSCSLILLELRNIAQLPRILPEDPLSPLQQQIRGEEIAAESLTDALLGILRSEPSQTHSSGDILAILEWSDSLAGSLLWNDLKLEEELLGAVDRWIDWLAELPAPGLIRHVVARAKGRFDREREHRYERIIRETEDRADKIIAPRLRQKEESQAPRTPATRLTLRMIGEIEICTDESAETTRIRGAATKRALGVLIADQILREPMTFGEIARLLSADEMVDPERGRKTVNNAVYKLRKLLGQSAFTTERGEVRLNREAVEIDLLEMTDLIESSEKGIESGTIGQNLQDIVRALDLYGKGIIFPGLYDPFFEAVRSELEWRIRSLLLGASSLLRAEGDMRGAEELLRRGVDRMPGDEEILEHLCEVLHAGGKFIEAERVRMREIV